MLPLAFPGLAGASSEERVAQMLELFHAGHLAKRMPADLSGGERQRVALARALAPEPTPAAAGRAIHWPRCGSEGFHLEQLTAWLAQREVPALYVSHDVAEAFQTAADVMVIDHGQIQAHGPAHVVLAARREQLLRQLGMVDT